MTRRALFLLFLLITQGDGRSGSRGASSARTASRVSSSASRSSPSISRPVSAPRVSAPVASAPRYVPSPSVVRPSVSRGSSISRGSSGISTGRAVLAGLAGAAAGVVAYQAGKAIIRSVTSPFRYNNRDYNWDRANCEGDSSRIKCSSSIAGEPDFENFYFDNGTQPQFVNWCCSRNEYCCNIDCCAY